MIEKIYFPENDYGIKVGYYTWHELVALLRENCDKAEVVRFIADMME
jgi:hypothetical protein